MQFLTITIFVFSLFFLNSSEYFYQPAYAKLISVLVIIFYLFRSNNTKLFNPFLIYPFIYFLIYQVFQGGLVYDSYLYFFIFLFTYIFKSKQYLINLNHFRLIYIVSFFVLVIVVLCSVDPNGRAIYPMGNKNCLGLFLATGAIYFLCCVVFSDIFKRNKLIFYIHVSMIGLLIIALIKNDSKGAILSLGFGVIFISLLKILGLKKNVLFLSVLSGLIFILFFGVILMASKPTFLHNMKNAGFRISVFDASIVLCRENPWLGHHANHFQNLISKALPAGSQYYEGMGDAAYHAHNEWIQLVFEHGLIGLLLFITFLLLVLFQTVNCILKSKSKDNPFFIYILVSIFMIFLQCSFDRIFRFPSVWSFFIFLLFLLNSNQKETKTNNHLKNVQVLLVLVFFGCFLWQIFNIQFEYKQSSRDIINKDFISAESRLSKISTNNFKIDLRVKSLIGLGYLYQYTNNEIKLKNVSNQLMFLNPLLIYPYQFLIEDSLKKGHVEEANIIIKNYNNGEAHIDLVNFYLKKRIQYKCGLDDTTMIIVINTLEHLKKVLSLPYNSKISRAIFLDYSIELVLFFRKNGFNEFSDQIATFSSKEFSVVEKEKFDEAIGETEN